MIEIRGVEKSYGATRVLTGVDLSAAPGEIVLMLGANGAGKSTLFRCMLGLTGYRGRIRVDGLDPLEDGRDVRRRIGYMPQRDGLHADLTVAATLDFYARLRGVGVGRVQELLTEARLEDARDTRVDQISGGMRQRLAFALAQLGDPPVLLLDEPTASLDGWSREHLTSRITRLAGAGKTVLMSTHVDPGLETGRSVVLDGGLLHEASAEEAGRAVRPAAPGSSAGVGSIGRVTGGPYSAAEGGRC